MEQELAEKLEHAEIPDGMKLAVQKLAAEAEALLPSLPLSQQWRMRSQINRVVTEAADPAAEPHWWPVYLDLMARTAGDCGADGQGLLAAIHVAGPLLHAHFGPYEGVTLQEINSETVWGVCQLSDTLREPQDGFVAPNAVSLAQGHFAKNAWFRAIYAGKAAVGFIMLWDDDVTPEYFLWRFMIAATYQKRGYGRQAIERLIEHVRTRPGARELAVSCEEGEGGPKPFYLKLGFVPTGELLDGETVLKLALD